MMEFKNGADNILAASFRVARDLLEERSAGTGLVARIRHTADRIELGITVEVMHKATAAGRSLTLGGIRFREVENDDEGWRRYDADLLAWERGWLRRCVAPWWNRLCAKVGLGRWRMDFPVRPAHPSWYESVRIPAADVDDLPVASRISYLLVAFEKVLGSAMGPRKLEGDPRPRGIVMHHALLQELVRSPESYLFMESGVGNAGSWSYNGVPIYVSHLVPENDVWII